VGGGDRGARDVVGHAVTGMNLTRAGLVDGGRSHIGHEDVGAAAAWGTDVMQRDFATSSLPCVKSDPEVRPAGGGASVAASALAERRADGYMQRGIATGGGSARQYKS
jgi:hypothetical protein